MRGLSVSRTDSVRLVPLARYQFTGGVNLMPKQDNGKTTQGVGPLDGLLIADFSRVLAGPYCTMLLGDLGATVMKVESPSGDDTRSWMPPDRHGVATYYLAINRNKRSV